MVSPRTLTDYFGRAIRMKVDARDVAVTVATVAGFFAARAGQAEILALPRLRWVQKLQLFPSLRWPNELLKIGPPPAPRPF
jgi:hypothetical protein